MSSTKYIGLLSYCFD